MATKRYFKRATDEEVEVVTVEATVGVTEEEVVEAEAEEAHQEKVTMIERISNMIIAKTIDATTAKTTVTTKMAMTRNLLLREREIRNATKKKLEDTLLKTISTSKRQTSILNSLSRNTFRQTIQIINSLKIVMKPF